ncbi:HELICASE-LIKE TRANSCRIPTION FACTOR CHR28 [Salix koriyanagi]|uniref:HELICASE-LIKE TRANSCRIPTION FACTOR CHR28 n=1 Tax=Salix koriyanagi TaxID=2511006 RepID=A0A9Q0UEQ9_9ROSI|nr:HELICASE-LIKE TRANSCRIPTION FACTOR CHR28 [Salix koriyanagi]
MHPEDAVVSVCGHVFCRQCICEHLIGDDSQCPVSDCKVRLNVSSVFSKATLNSSLSDEPGQDCSGSELVAEVRSFSDSRPHDSSKIRAALEVLQSLTKPNDCLPTCNLLENSVDENVACHEASSGSTDSFKDGMDKRHLPIKAVGEKAIVFSQWTGMLDLLEACLKSSSIQYRRLDGTMSVIARDKALKDFNTLPEVSVMIMSLKAASLGLNMVAACHVLLLDLWWNPTTEDQAIDRAHRIGQTRTVTVLRLTVQKYC